MKYGYCSPKVLGEITKGGTTPPPTPIVTNRLERVFKYNEHNGGATNNTITCEKSGLYLVNVSNGTHSTNQSTPATITYENCELIFESSDFAQTQFGFVKTLLLKATAGATITIETDARTFNTQLVYYIPNVTNATNTVSFHDRDTQDKRYAYELSSDKKYLVVGNSISVYPSSTQTRLTYSIEDVTRNDTESRVVLRADAQPHSIADILVIDAKENETLLVDTWVYNWSGYYMFIFELS